MKKIIKKILILTIIIVISIGLNVYAATPTLDQIVNSFNNCKSVKQIKELADGNSLTASSTGNTLTITAATNDDSTEIVYTLSDNILSTTLAKDDLSGGIASLYLIDSIGQLQGYEDGELFSTLNSEKITNYTVDKEGIEIKNLEDGSVSIKIDISKKIPLIDLSDSYIEVSDLQDLKNYISGDGSAEKSKGNVWFNKSGYNGENTLIVAEKDNLTDNTYKSILSIIEVMFDSSKASDYFKTNYSGMNVGNKEFSGFKIEINPTKTEFEEGLIPLDSGYKFVRITINKSLVNSAITGNNQKNDITINLNNNSLKEENTVTKQSNNKTTRQGTLPYTGLSIVPIISVIIISISAAVLYKKYNKYKDIK